MGKTLPGLHRPSGSKTAPDALHQREIVRREHRRHVLRLVRADAVLAGQRAARLDAVGEDLRGDLGRLVRLARNPLVVTDQRMQIAVAGVKDVADAKPRGPLERADARQHLRQPRPRHDAVLDVVVRRDAAHRGECRLAAAPDARALVVVCATSIVVAPCRRQMSTTVSKSVRDLGGGAVELDDQNGVGVGEVRVHRGFGGADGERVHHLDRRRDDPGADDVGHGAAAGVDRVERGQQRLNRFGPPEDPDRRRS